MKSRTIRIVLGALALLPLAVSAIEIRGNVGIKGDLIISDGIAKGSGTFVIDHPLDPRSKLLLHSFVESPDAKNLYDGIATLDSAGEARIRLPDYFEALNKDYRYQFFPHGQPMPGLYVKQEVKGNEFIIAGGAPGGEITWQVTGTRKDAYMLANPLVNEVPKGPGQAVDKDECLFEPLCE